MGQSQSGCPCCFAHCDGVLGSTMSPPDLTRVLVQGELRVVDDEVSTGEKLAMLSILSPISPLPDAKWRENGS